MTAVIGILPLQHGQAARTDQLGTGENISTDVSYMLLPTVTIGFVAALLYQCLHILTW